MIALLQRVSSACVHVSNERVVEIGNGLLVFVGVQRDDGHANAARLAERVVGYRVFPDDGDRMNLSVRDVRGALLLVPQFTLAADTTKGTRASFTSAAGPETGRQLFDTFAACVRETGLRVATGIFGADMAVQLTNQGPVTFWLRA